jgi:hypothetical protein
VFTNQCWGAAKQRRKEANANGTLQSPDRPDSGSDPEGEGQGQRDDGSSDTAEDVALEIIETNLISY